MNAPGNGAPGAMTEINFGLHSAESVRLARHGRPGQGSTDLRTAIIRYASRAVGLMEIENLFRYPARAVGLKPSAMRGEARLRGLYRIIYSKTIISGIWCACPDPLPPGQLPEIHFGRPVCLPRPAAETYNLYAPSARRNLSELVTTKTELHAIAAAASMGLSCHPVSG